MGTSARPTVWVVKEQVVRNQAGSNPMDYTPAEKFGTVEFITDYDFPMTRGPSGLKDAWHKRVHQFLYAYKGEHDYIVLTGSPLAIFLIGFICAISTTAPRVLVWRRESNDYALFDTLEFIESIPKDLK